MRRDAWWSILSSLPERCRCVIVPHIASATLETRKHMATYAAQNLIAAILGGDMPAQVDLSAFS